jgi:eukaryotic-like serine/threonine-protein kinase
VTNFEEQLKNALAQDYDIERELGGGGMSRVFVAIEKSLGRKVVIKVLSPELTAEVNRGRFRREIQVAAQLQHPHIVPLLAAGEDGDIVYYTMPFIKGESLKTALQQNGPFGVPEVVRVLYDVVDALAYAHDNGVVHRDIKPANILRSGAHALVTDFGVAKALNAAMSSVAVTSTGMAVGTPAYMSPEQLAGDPAADHRIDIYAVGLLAYELLTGKSPFAARSPREVLASVLMKEPPPLAEVRADVPLRLSAMVMKCLAKDPLGRPPSAMVLMDELDMFATASGEIRTHEHRVPLVTPTTPLSNPVVLPGDTATSGSITAPADLQSGTFPEQAVSSEISTSSGTVPGYAPARPQRKWRKPLAAVVAVVLPIAATAIFLSQTTGETSPAGSAPPVNAAVADSGSLPQPVATALPESTTLPAAPAPDSQALADSAKARLARAERKRAAQAKADSQRQKPESETSGRSRRAARWAATAMLEDANARKAFMRGATRQGGFLGAQKRGDLQTQIDALQPFLSKHGLTYDQFKRIAQEAGFNIFDSNGRMVPDAVQRFAGSSDSQ